MNKIRFFSSSETVQIENNLIKLQLSKETGNIVRLSEKIKKQEIIKGDLKAPAVVFVINDEYLIPDKEHGFILSDVSFDNEGASGKISLTLKDKDSLWEVKQEFNLRLKCGLLEKKAEIQYFGKDKKKLQSVAFIIPRVGIGKLEDWSYQILGHFPPERIQFNKLIAKREVGDATTSAIIRQSSQDWNLLTFFYSETEEKYLQIKEGQDSIELVQIIPVQARLDQKRKVSVGIHYLYYVQGSYKQGLKGFHDLYDLIGLEAPKDTPDWARDALIFQSHPGGCMETECRDIGGAVHFKEHYLPYIRKIGFNTFYFLPVMQAHGGPYVGWDFYKIDKRAGDEKELKSLVHVAHKNGIRTMYDIVPLGKSFDYPDLDKFEEWMCKDEQEQRVKSWGVLRAFDYTHKDYQKYMAAVAAHYVREHNIDGYRVDSAFGDSHNWDPSRTDRPTASAHGGIAMMNEMRKAIKQVKRDTVLLPEAFNKIEFFKVSDFIYDYSLFIIFSRYFNYPTSEWCTHLRNWLNLQRYISPKGAVWMRFVSNHDTFRGPDYYGVGLAKALNALCTVIDGNLLFYMYEEIGSQPFYQRLFAIRKVLPELNRGSTSYDAVKCDKQEVFTCLREYGKACSVPAINLTPDKVRVEIEFQLPKMLLNGKSGIAIIDSWKKKIFHLVERDSLLNGKVKLETVLEGYACRIFTVRPIKEPQNIDYLMKETGLAG